GMSLLTQIVVNVSTPGSGSGSVFTTTDDFTFSGYSARWVALVLTPFSSRLPAPSVPPSQQPLPLIIRDVSLQLSRVATSACMANELLDDDAVVDLPKSRLLVKLKAGATDDDRQRVINGLRSYIRSPLITIQDTAALLSATDIAIVGLDIFFV